MWGSAASSISYHDMSELTTAPPHRCDKLSGMPRFSIKDLMLTTTLVATGVAIEIWLFTHKPKPEFELDGADTVVAIACAGLAVIVAGLLAPFSRRAVAVALKIAAAFGLYVAMCSRI